MNNNLLGEQIARFRKALGMTQEDLGKAVGISAQAVSRWECGGAPDVTLLPAVADTLGVTVDALFGREAGERIKIEDAVRRWMLTVPQGQRVDKLCRLVWTAAGPVMSMKPEDRLDISGYEACCETENPENGDRWLRRTRIMMEDGIILGVRAEDMSFAAVFPEPEVGWEPFFAITPITAVCLKSWRGPTVWSCWSICTASRRSVCAAIRREPLPNPWGWTYRKRRA